MRWLFLFVLSLNLAYFAWQLSKTSSVDYANVPALKNVAPIILLSELKAKDTTKLAEKSSLQQISLHADNAAAEKSSVSEESEEQLVENDLTENNAGKDKVPAATPTLKDVVVKEAVQPKVEEVATVEKTLEATLPQPRCYTLGPFRDLDKLRALTREIKSYVKNADFRGNEENEQALYWVYLNPEKTQKKAIAVGRRLKAKKIKDFYVIRDGDKINGLSLGHFRNKAGAYGLAKKVKKLGFDVTVEPIFKTYTVYWLDYRLVDGVSIPEATLEKHIKTQEKNKISRLNRECAG